MHIVAICKRIEQRVCTVRDGVQTLGGHVDIPFKVCRECGKDNIHYNDHRDDRRRQQHCRAAVAESAALSARSLYILSHCLTSLCPTALLVHANGDEKEHEGYGQIVDYRIKIEHAVCKILKTAVYRQP